MTEAAEAIRDQRRAWATPGGSHDKLVRRLAVILPGAVGLIAAIMVLAPLSPRGEVSFLLDRNKVAITSERIRVAQAVYRGEDDQGRAFAVQAGSAAQVSAKVPVIQMQDLMATLALAEGPATLTAPSGDYNYDTDRIMIDGPVKLATADDYQLEVSNVAINLKNRTLAGSGGVSGAFPAGTFSAQRIFANLGERTVTLDGDARLQMEPGKFRMPS
jgi:lipopolysaccharide export system protein LptC